MIRALVGILIGAGFVAAIVLATLDQMRVTCRVCMEYRGQRLCEESVAEDRSQAVMHATASVCARLSGGVTDGIRCSNTPPQSVECSD